MFHALIPLIPLSLGAAYFFRRDWLAYGFPIGLILFKIVFTQPSFIYLFMGAALLVAVWIARKFRAVAGTSFAAWGLVSLASVLIYEGIANFGVWFLGGCAADQAPLYPLTLQGLRQCYQAAWAHSALHALRDIPLSVFAIWLLHAFRNWMAARAQAHVPLVSPKG